MPSPFPGMDPYLEGYLWPDVHNALAAKIRQLLAPQLQPRYVARLELYVVEDEFPENEVGIIYPDVEVIERKQAQQATELQTSGNLAITPAPLTIPFISSVPVRIPTVEIRDTRENLLVTCIEILSPVNKRNPGLARYRQKRQRLHQAGVHVLEIDLLRRGQRPFTHSTLTTIAYAIALTRAEKSVVEIWPLKLPDPLPVIPIPLKSPDPDVPLDLSTALTAIYDEAFYRLSIDYTQNPPPPDLSETDRTWLTTLLTS
ncbi:MAG: DUF4058 family protein [Cyanobacteria bacterium P01_F01_bin.86]